LDSSQGKFVIIRWHKFQYLNAHHQLESLNHLNWSQANLDLAYESAEEDAFRKAIFAQTDAMIQEHNNDPESTYQMAHNQFSAMVNIHFQVPPQSMFF